MDFKVYLYRLANILALRLIILLFYIFSQLDLYSQINYTPFPETCDFIYTHDNGVTYLSSVNGIYTFKGTAPPQKLPLTGLDNRNIQSSFFPGKGNHLWFSTYNRIVRYDLVTGQANPYPVVFNGQDTMHSDYYIFKIDTLQELIWGKQDLKIFAFNTTDHSSRLICDSIRGRRILTTSIGDSDYLLSYYFAYKPAIVQINKRDLTWISTRLWTNWPEKCIATDLCLVDSAHVLIATNKGLFIGDIVSGTFSELFINDFKSGIGSIGPYLENRWILSPKNGNLVLLKKDPYNLTFTIEPFQKSKDIIQAYRILTGKDNTIFLSSKDDGIYFFHPDKKKFINWETRDIKGISNKRLTADRLQYLSQEIEMTSNGTPFAFHQDYNIISAPPYKTSKYIHKGNSQILQHPDSSQLYRYFIDAEGNMYAGFHETGLFKFNNTTWTKIPFPSGYSNQINFYNPVNDTLSIASINQEKIILWNPMRSEQTLSEKIFSGDLYNIYHPPGEGFLYISTDQGLITFDIATHAIDLVDTERQYACFCLLPDKKGNIWFSSPSGLFMYDPVKRTTRQFHISDGVIREEYAKRRCEKLSADSLLFFYNGGATLVQPSAINPIDSKSKIYLTGFRVNDIDHEHSDILNYVSHFITKYEDNTLSFEISSIDWSDPVNANLQYKLEGYDDHWVMPERNNAFVRYPKLPPGEYTLFIKGANADGIWNEEEKKILITVIPPFWMRWWFITGIIIAIGLSLYLLVRSYYRRKIEKKNQLLREQSLIIEKQQAVENERTRIASEMHDDLGSGLTTIRYLSDKALKQAKDAEEAVQIKKIADHSNTLVRNMSEIIWAMNSRFDNTENLIGYLRRYASEYLDEHHIALEFIIEDLSGSNGAIGGEKRRNLFLVFKEILHNSVKYSSADTIQILIKAEDLFEIHISEIGGKGFDPDLAQEKGNGLYNCTKRMNLIGGTISYLHTGTSMDIVISAPIAAV